MKNIYKPLLTAGVIALLVGCAGTPQQPSQASIDKTTQTGVRVGKSDVGVPKTASVEYIRIKTERSIFLDPPEGNTDIYLRVGDTSGREWAGIPMRDLIAAELQKRGFQVVRNASTAGYSLQVNILLADEVSAAELANVDETKYGQDLSSLVKSVALGTVIGGVAGSVLGNSDRTLAGAVVGGIAGGILGGLSGSRKRDLVKAQQQTKFFSLIMDVEVRERARGTVTRSGSTDSNSTQQSSTSDTVASNRTGGATSVNSAETESYTEESTWKRQRTRIIGKAKGKLVVFEDVEQDFALKAIKAIAGFF